MDFINSLEPSIQFTCELEVCSSIPFLDVVIDRNNDGKFSTKVSRKITHTNRYLDFKSNHPLQHKLSVVRSLRNRASYFSSSMEEADKEHNFIRNVLSSNNYPRHYFDLKFLLAKRKMINLLSFPMSRVALNASPAFYVPTVFRLFTNL